MLFWDFVFDGFAVMRFVDFAVLLRDFGYCVAVLVVSLSFDVVVFRGLVFGVCVLLS